MMSLHTGDGHNRLSKNVRAGTSINKLFNKQYNRFARAIVVQSFARASHVRY